VVETDIDFPTDSSLLGDGGPRADAHHEEGSSVAGAVVTSVRDRTRSVQRRLLEIVRASRDKSERGQQKLTAAYCKLLDISGRVVGTGQKGFCRTAAQKASWVAVGISGNWMK
jgi:IS5 family transposase